VFSLLGVYTLNPDSTNLGEGHFEGNPRPDLSFKECKFFSRVGFDPTFRQALFYKMVRLHLGEGKLGGGEGIFLLFGPEANEWTLRNISNGGYVD
jgi:hypothetical protein